MEYNSTLQTELKPFIKNQRPPHLAESVGLMSRQFDVSSNWREVTIKCRLLQWGSGYLVYLGTGDPLNSAQI